MTDQTTPDAPKRRYPHVYYRRERRPAAPVYEPYGDDDGYDYQYYALDNPRDLPDPRDLDRGDEPPDADAAVRGGVTIWKWFLVAVMLIVVISMIAADLQGVIVPPEVLPTPTRPIIPL